MRAVCVRTYLDLKTGKLRNEGEEFETTPERLQEINGTKYGQLAVEVAEKAAEAPTEPQRAKRTRRTRKTEE